MMSEENKRKLAILAQRRADNLYTDAKKARTVNGIASLTALGKRWEKVASDYRRA